MKMNIHSQFRAARCFQRLSVVLCWILSSGFCYGQSYIFESPNTREHMSDNEAVQSLNSHEQRNFEAVAGYLSQKLCSDPAVAGGVGMFAGSSENSVMITGCKDQTAVYLGELLARYAHQEWFLVFTPDLRGSERLLVVTLKGSSVADLAVEMRKAGLNTGTILSHAGEISVYLWEKNHSQDDAIHTLAITHQGQIREIPGQGKLTGSDSRAQARRIFDREIAGYERQRSQKLSALLRSRRLHNMGLSGPR
jgi:hypothetical protein